MSLFESNLAALTTRYPKLAEQILQVGSRSMGVSPMELVHGRDGHATFSKIPDLKPLLNSLAPNNNFATPTLIVGMDDGQLEQALQAIPCHHPALPGFRPPIYLLCSRIEQLAAVLHQRDWQAVLNDPRFYLFVGSDAAAQFQMTLRQNQRLPHPKYSLNIESEILLPFTNLDALLAPIQTAVSEQCAATIRQLNQIYSSRSRGMKEGRLKVLGLTSRYTTFLQHSMRDWLSAMRRLGHETRLLIEDADHEVLNTLCHARACLDFQPDLILLIDHYRAEFPGLPTQVPAVMWIQDLLPNIFNPAAGPKQSPLDFCLGYGRLRCVGEFGYDESRFMPAVVGVNEQRFAPKRLTDRENLDYLSFEKSPHPNPLLEYRERGQNQNHNLGEANTSDVCYVGHTGKIAEELVRDQLQQISDSAAPKLFWDIYERIRTVYQHAGFIGDPLHIDQIIRQSLSATGLSVPPTEFQRLSNFFSHQVNYAFFRHCTLEWLLDLDVNVHLYGRGWENHPTLKRFAKGVADNQKHLAAIYQAAKINLQITPHGIVHQRLFEGLCAGGFFLVRHRPGDVVERIHRLLWEFCQANNIRNDAELKAQATPQVKELLAQLQRCIGLDPFDRGFELVADLRLSADSDFGQSAATLWPEQYDQIAFTSQNELHDKVQYYLQHPGQRRSISTAMQRIVLERMTYMATSRRLLEFIRANLQPLALGVAA